MLRLQARNKAFSAPEFGQYGRMLSQIDQGSGVRYQTSTDKFTDEDCEV